MKCIRRTEIWTIGVFLFLVFATTALLTILAAERSYFGYGTETDYVSGMLEEARRLLAGDPLLSEFHPPGFIIAMVASYLVWGDWFVAGKGLSVLSGAVAIIASFGLFRFIAGPFAALGATVALISSMPFLTYSMQATSDVFFLAIYYLTCLLAAFAVSRNSAWLWLGVGMLVIVATMTRTNGITLLLLLALPVFLGERSNRTGALAGGVAGLALALLAFVSFAQVTGSNLMPKGTYHNIAITYFTEERISWEGMTEARSRFDSLVDVLAYDPVAMAKSYARDLLDLTLRDIPQLGGPVLAMLFFPGLLFAVGDRRRPLFWLFFAITVAQLLLVNLKAYEPRYHLYFVPWIGAGAAISLSLIFEHKEWVPRLRVPLLTLAGAMIVLGGVYAWSGAWRFAALGGNPELARVLPAIQATLSADDAIVARKSPQISYYTGAIPVWLPDVGSGEDLRASLEAAQAVARPGGSVYLFVGEVEQRVRPDVSRITSNDTMPQWLEQVAGAVEGPEWTLLRYLPRE